MGRAGDLRSHGCRTAAFQDMEVAGRHSDAVFAGDEYADRFHPNGVRSRFQAEKIPSLALAMRVLSVCLSVAADRSARFQSGVFKPRAMMRTSMVFRECYARLMGCVDSTCMPVFQRRFPETIHNTLYIRIVFVRLRDSF